MDPTAIVILCFFAGFVAIILEESAKLLCSASLALTLFLGLCGVVREHVSTGVRQKHRLIEPL